jgi:pyrimidine-nucleoside phosphorylase
MYDIIRKKQTGGSLTKEELRFVITGYTKGEIPDYQMSAFLMAVWFQGMNREETVDFTLAMADSGDRMDLSGIHGIKVDKHSTGGVGDKTTLIIGPILASLGVPIAKMSGRGLGHTGGTIDKLESIPGFQTSISEEKFVQNVNDIGIALAGQTANLAPADKKIYALRDVTGTVDSAPLIASSVMSKKLASGADAILLDVKCGSGAFMQSLEAAEELARIMVEIGNMAGRKTAAVISDMNEPLGRMVGNSLEVKEAISVLQGQGEERLTELSIELSVQMLLLSGILPEEEKSRETALAMVHEAIQSGRALDKLAEFVTAQGGDASYIEQPDKFREAAYKVPVTLGQSGYLSGCSTSEVGMVSLMLGAGRAKKEDAVNPAAGIELRKGLGDWVEGEEIFAYLYTDDKSQIEEAAKRLCAAYRLKPEKIGSRPVIQKIII